MLIATLQGVTEDDIYEEVTGRWEDGTETDNDTTLTLQERLPALTEKGIDLKRHDIWQMNSSTHFQNCYTPT